MRLGNEALKVSLWGPPEQLTWSINKTDVWDRRLFPEKKAITIAEIREICQGASYQEKPFTNRHSYYDSYQAYDFPCPKPVGQLSLICPELSGIKDPTATLRHSDGHVTVPLNSAKLDGTVASLVMMTRNLLLVRAKFAGLTQPLKVRLYRHRDTLQQGKCYAEGGPEPRPLEDYDYSKDAPANAPLPPPVAGTDGHFFWIRQEFPGEATFPNGFFYVFMAAVADDDYKVEIVEGRKGLGAPPFFSVTTHGGKEGGRRADLPFSGLLPWYEPIRQATGAAATAEIDAHSITILATVVTSAEAADPLGTAKQELRKAEGDGYDALVAENRNWYQAFYERREAGRIYYREQERNPAAIPEIFRSWTSHHSGGTKPAISRWEGDASYAYFEQDWSPWHADNHFNEAEYTATCVQNRIDRLQMWYEIGEFILPLARRNAREVYDCQGAMCGLCHVPVRTASIYHANVIWEQGLEMMAQLARMFWQRYDYSGDESFLCDKAYPLLKAGADFYCDYLTLGPDGCYHVEPTVSQEHWGLTYRFERNRDSISALCLIKWHLKTTARAAEILGKDTDQVERWRGIARRMAPYPAFVTDDGPIFVDVAGTPPIEYNLAPPLYPTILADEINLDSDPGDLEVMIRTARSIKAWQGRIDAALRLLGLLPGAEPENLLNSRSGWVRLFPSVPKGLEVGFHKFLACGAFEISAELIGGKVAPIFIKSFSGNDFKFINPWSGRTVKAQDLTSQEPVTIHADANHAERLFFATQKGHQYSVESRPACS